ncbi:MAG: Sb-PDE family phosphodiesterase [Planctomycetes bacterium]|nr:Sb-PDE family phosphodiesterase [Planctomycetota bacterium]
MNTALRSRPAVLSLLVLLLSASAVVGQVRREIRIPDVMGYKTLKCDFHMHTVFSDGLVWPTVRVDEAWQEGLDAIAITDHIEYRPHKQDIAADLNRSYEIALPRAKEKGILLVHAAEITRETPPGHFNALFLEDATPLDTKDLLDAMAAADKQGAFIWWNHPDWIPDRKGWFDIHTTLYEKKYLRGIEVVNGRSYYPTVFQWALDKNLTILGNSDIHEPTGREDMPAGGHRPMTFVFVKDKSIPALKEALSAGRTAVWFENKIIARREYAEALFQAAVRVTDVERGGKKVVLFTVRNDSDLPVELQRTGKLGPKEQNLPGNTSARMKISVDDTEKPIELSYTATNFLIAPEKGLPVKLLLGL